MKKFWTEFRTFALKSNMIDLAVGVIIGSAFNGLVTGLVNSIFMPVLSLLTGRIDFANLFVALDGQQYSTLAAAQEAGASCIAYGSFIQKLIEFLFMALVVFLFVKLITRARKAVEQVQKKQPAAPTTKKCPYCKSVIPIDATRCPNCTSELEAEEPETEKV